MFFPRVFALLTCAVTHVTPLDLCHASSTQVNSYDYRNRTTQNCNCTANCIRKCCAIGFYLSKGACLRHGSSFNISLYKEERFVRNESFEDTILVGVSDCDYFPLIPANDPVEDAFRVQDDGRIWTRVFGFVESEKYCVDDMKKFGPVALVCYHNEDVEGDDVFHQVFIIGMIISIPFLLATFIIHALLPERSELMKALMCYVVNLMFGYSFLVAIYFSFTLTSVPCLALGHLCLFFFMASFLWLNVICIETWLTVCTSARSDVKKRRFFWYCFYAWGLAVIHFFVVFAINQAVKAESWHHPRIGEGQCFIGAGYPELLYFYGPVGVLIVINIILFAITAAKIWEMQRGTSVRNHEKQIFVLYFKLLFASGINWSLEVISWAINWKAGHVPAYIWYLTDFCNALYGVFIFAIFVCNRNMLTLLRKRYFSTGNKSPMEHSMTVTRVPSNGSLNANAKITTET